MSHPFYLRLPYVAKLDTQIEPGQSLIVRGHATGNTFVINLAAGSSIDECKDLIFHMSCRIKEKTIVYNTLSAGTFGKEVRHKCPIETGANFNIRIRCHDNKFEAYVNGKSMCEFPYRQAIAAVTHVHVFGDLTLNAVGWEGNYYSVPYKINIPGNFVRQRKLFLTFVPDDDEHVNVNFLVGEQDIAFHFNPRFNKKHTINNALFGGVWGKEEIVPKFPFARKQAVDLMFVCEQDQFGVYVNGEPYCTFAHRIDPGKIDGLRINGQMELQVVNFE